MEVFALPHLDLPAMYVLVPDWCVGQGPSHLVLVPSRVVFALYSFLMLCGSKADKTPVWQIEITEFLVFAFVSSVAAAGDIAFMSKTVALHIAVDGLGCWYRFLTLTVWPVGEMIWASFQSFSRRGLILCWSMSHFFWGKRSTGLR